MPSLRDATRTAGYANGGNLRSTPVRTSRGTLPVRLARFCA
ncbi:MAG: hypothetical protein V7L20_25925 [Nostoc sp.]